MKVIVLIFFASQLFQAKDQRNILVGTKWNVYSLYLKHSNNTLVNNGLMPEECELHFKKNSVSVNTCNSYNLKYNIENNTLVFYDGPPGLQARYCGSGYANKVEEIMFRLNSANFTLQNDTLKLTTPNLDVITCVKIK